MKRLLFSVLLLTLIFALTCGATDTRVLTLGNANMILKDDANIFTDFYNQNPNTLHQVGFPQVITHFRGLAVGDITGAGVYPGLTGADLLFRVGAHYDLGQDNGVVGVYIDNRPTPYAFPQQPAPELNGVSNRLNLFYGRPFGDMDFGANLVLFHNSHKVEGDTANNVEQANTTIALNLGLTMMKNLDLGLGVRMGSWTNKNNTGTEVSKPKSDFGLILGGRYWWAFNNDVDFVPHAQFIMDGTGYTTPGTAGTEFTDKVTAFNVGWGVNVRPVDRVLLLFDLGVSWDKQTLKNTPTGGTSTETKNTLMDLPYYKVGLEGHVTRWWDVRLGAVKGWESAKVEATGTTTTGTSPTTTYLGSGFHFGNLTVDGWINPNFALNGPNFVSGYSSTLAYQVSLLYSWK